MGWEFVCPQCGVRHPSIRTLVGFLAIWAILLAVHSLMFLDRTTLFDGVAVAALVFLIVFSSLQVIVLQKRRKRFGPCQFPR